MKSTGSSPRGTSMTPKFESNFTAASKLPPLLKSSMWEWIFSRQQPRWGRKVGFELCRNSAPARWWVCSALFLRTSGLFTAPPSPRRKTHCPGKGQCAVGQTLPPASWMSFSHPCLLSHAHCGGPCGTGTLHGLPLLCVLFPNAHHLNPCSPFTTTLLVHLRPH